MAENRGKWASNNGQIIKSGLSDGRRANFLPSVVGLAYDWLRYECHLGNIGLNLFDMPPTCRVNDSALFRGIHIKGVWFAEQR